MRNRLRRIMPRTETLRDDLESQSKQISTIGVSGGVSFVVGATLATLNPAMGLISLVMLVGGAGFGGAGWIGARRLDRERTVYKQIAERMSEINKAIDK